MENFGWILPSLLFTYVACSTITRFKDPMPECEENTVCSKIHALSYFVEERHYFSYVTCQCPNGQKCPESPGKQTISVGEGLWYGLCTPITDMRPCIPGETAEKLQIDLDRKPSIKIVPCKRFSGHSCYYFLFADSWDFSYNPLRMKIFVKDFSASMSGNEFIFGLKFHNDELHRVRDFQINCICPAHELEMMDRGESAAEWVRSNKNQNGYTVHELVCGSTGAGSPEKRRGREFRKFYFYKK